MENVLPALLKPSKEAVQSRAELVSSERSCLCISSPTETEVGLSDLLRTFTDAATHVPRHRQTRFVRCRSAIYLADLFLLKSLHPICNCSWAQRLPRPNHNTIT